MINCVLKRFLSTIIIRQQKFNKTFAVQHQKVIWRGTNFPKRQFHIAYGVKGMNGYQAFTQILLAKTNARIRQTPAGGTLNRRTDR